MDINSCVGTCSPLFLHRTTARVRLVMSTFSPTTGAMQQDNQDGDEHDGIEEHDNNVQMSKRLKITEDAPCLVDVYTQKNTQHATLVSLSNCKDTAQSIALMVVDYAFVQALAMGLYETLGPGFSESVYQKALSYDLCEHHILHEMERVIPVMYKQLQIGVLRTDIVVDNHMVVELKRVLKITRAHLQQAERYARLLNLSKIIVINVPCPSPPL